MEIRVAAASGGEGRCTEKVGRAFSGHENVLYLDWGSVYKNV